MNVCIFYYDGFCEFEVVHVAADYIQFFKNSTILNEDIVVDGNIITSTGQAFIEFAFKLADIMNIYKDEDEIQKSYNWYKNIKV